MHWSADNRLGELMLSLYFAPGTSSMAPHIALHEIGVPFESFPLSFAKGEQRQSSYLSTNAEGKVPTLMIDERPLTEVAAILYYLARAYPEAELMPRNDSESEAQVISWMSFIASTLHPARFRGAEHALSVYRIADERLGPAEWAIGQYSIADIHLFRLYWRLCNALDFPVGLFPQLQAHHERMMKRPAVRKAIAIEEALGYELNVWFPNRGSSA
jgi:glutathione S-transferase